MILYSALFQGRINFGQFLNERNLKGYGVEIGTHRGEFASQLLSKWEGFLYCIDPWTRGYDNGDPASEGDRVADYHTALDNLRRYRNRSQTLVLPSLKAAKLAYLNHLDFVYVDGCHQYADVRQDLNLWWPKLKTGGILAGHDIVCPVEPDGGWGKHIQPAVFEFAKEHGLDVYLVREEAVVLPWSYYLIKKEVSSE